MLLRVMRRKYPIIHPVPWSPARLLKVMFELPNTISSTNHNGSSSNKYHRIIMMKAEVNGRHQAEGKSGGIVSEGGNQVAYHIRPAPINAG